MAFELKQEVYDRIKDRCIDILKNRSVSRADEMINELMDLEGVIIHCPYHHFIVPATLLTCSYVTWRTVQPRDVSEFARAASLPTFVGPAPKWSFQP